MTPKSRRSIGFRILFTFGVISCVLLLTAATFLGGMLVDGFSFDARADYVSARLVTREVAAGDDVSIDLFPDGIITAIHARFGGGPMQDVRRPAWNSDQDRIVVQLAPDLPLGPVEITLDVELMIRLETGRNLNTHYYRHATRNDKLEIALQVRAPDERTQRQWMFRGLALAAWIAVCGASYASGRWAFRSVLARRRRKGRSITTEIAMLVCFVVAVVVAAVGQLIFVNPIVRTTTLASWLPILGVQFAWNCAIGLGLWRGLVARSKAPAPHLWEPLRVRAVVGSQREVGYRDVASTLPPMLTRDAPRCDSTRVIDALRELGHEVTRNRNVLEVNLNSEPVMQLRARCPEPWLPEDLGVSIRDGIDATPLVLQLTKIYGALEVKPQDGRAVILEQRV